MKKTVLTFAVVAALMLSLAGCGEVPTAENQAPAAEPQVTEDVQAPVEGEEQTAPAEPSEAPAEPARQDGERFETTIVLEGMEETVQYEHIVNTALGFEMDYDYENFVRQSDGDRERFISVWDDPEHPENYMELTYSPEDAETAAASIIERLSQDYDITQETRVLDHAGECIWIEASVIKGTNNMAEQLQWVYIIPAQDGCRIATVHSFITESEGFSRRFGYMLDTLVLTEK